MDSGSSETTQRIAAHAAGLAFAITYLIASAAGVEGGTVLLRSCAVAVTMLLVANLLARPVVDVVLDAIARDEARRAAERAKEDSA